MGCIQCRQKKLLRIAGTGGNLSRAFSSEEYDALSSRISCVPARIRHCRFESHEFPPLLCYVVTIEYSLRISVPPCTAGFALAFSDCSPEKFYTTEVGMRLIKFLAAFLLLLGGCSEDPSSRRIQSWRNSLKSDVPDFDETRTAAEGGSADAQMTLGEMYADGIGVTQDAVEAVKWYRVAAERGYPESQYRLGGMYYRGEGVLQDQVEAAEWYLKAAKQGHVDAVSRIGEMNEDGIGVPQDLVEAYAWYAVGCKIGHKGFLLRLHATEAALGNKRNGMLAGAKKRAADYLNRYGRKRRPQMPAKRFWW